jgi:hypothetical protein
VPWAELVCGRAGDDGDGMVVQLSRSALRLLSRPAARTGPPAGVPAWRGESTPTCRGGDVRVSGSRRVLRPTP